MESEQTTANVRTLGIHLAAALADGKFDDRFLYPHRGLMLPTSDIAVTRTPHFCHPRFCELEL